MAITGIKVAITGIKMSLTDCKPVIIKGFTISRVSGVDDRHTRYLVVLAKVHVPPGIVCRVGVHTSVGTAVDRSTGMTQVVTTVHKTKSGGIMRHWTDWNTIIIIIIIIIIQTICYMQDKQI